MTRFRLRFLLQEIDLPQGDTLVGRSANCQVTLDDPLVSREHARIRIQGATAMLEDLGSRNGVQVGGQPVAGRRALGNGDRIRIGTQELVFLELPASAERPTHGGTRQTGFMCHCAACARAFPAELVACPACGSRERVEEDTLTGNTRRDWGLELAAEAVLRARTAGVVEDLERVLSHARLGLEQRLAEGRDVQRHLIDGIGAAAVEVAVSRGEAGWGRWALSIYASLGVAPPASLSDELIRLPPNERALLEPAAQRAFDSCGANASADEAVGQAALGRLLGERQVVKHVLRYQHHDIELSEGKFVIGRAATCQLSLDDPLVSRHHAQLTVVGDAISVEDLGSRNGVKVNGELINGPYSVKDKDQIVIGGQELKYLARKENMGDTLIQAATQRVPTFGLLGISADKAFALGRADEAERLLTELLDQVLADLEAGREVKSDLFDRSTEYAMKLAGATGTARWVEYIFRAFASVRRPCPAGIVDELYSLVRRVERVNLSALRTYIDVLREHSGTLGPTDRFLVSRIEGLERLVAAR